MVDIYSYGETVLSKFPNLAERVESNTLIPHQVEIHPPPITRDLCWLRCKHCYTQTELDEIGRISSRRLVEIIEEISNGSPRTKERPEKIIISGFRTDPLNSSTILDVLKASKRGQFVTGVHTKGLKLTDELIDELVRDSLEDDYISFSIDAGNNATYNSVHGVKSFNARLYDRVRQNIERLMARVRTSGSDLKVRVTYLLTNENVDQQVSDFISHFVDSGVHTVRFSVPIFPTMGLQERVSDFPKMSIYDFNLFEEQFYELKKDGDNLVYLKFDSNPQGVMPCWSRWLLPTVGYDGYLYPCCLVSSEEFRSLRIEDLKEVGFWDAYHRQVDLNFGTSGCQCDRKAAEIHNVVNSRLRKLGDDENGKC
jgi:MoaA/NifB/PqqE/SkfB family radical SAM enzyme